MELYEKIKMMRPFMSDSEIISELAINNSIFYNLVEKYNIDKLPNSERNLNKLKKQIPRDELKQYYIDENHSFYETQAHFKIQSGLPKLLSAYDLHKGKDQHIEKIKETKRSRYGNENYNNSTLRAKTNLERYGVDNQFKREELMADIRDANERKYGSKNNIQKNHKTRELNSGSVKKSYIDQIAKTKATCIEKYGVDWASKSTVVKEHIKESLKATFNERYGCDNYWLMDGAKRSSGSKNSAANINFEKLLEDANIKYEREFKLDNRFYDFKVGSYLIEINPTATHNNTWSPWSADGGLDKTYHADKSLLAQMHGYRCIHIWDWDNPKLIIDLLLKDRMKIYARNCIVKQIDVRDEKDFLNAYHLQGYIKSDVAIGLYFNDELVQLMSFGKARYSKKCDIELLRLCSKHAVIGGASKLFQWYVKNYSPISIISYCDMSKFSGKVYSDLGFKFIRKSISRHWYNLKLDIHITDNLLNQRGFDSLLGNMFGKYGCGTSNEALMLGHNFLDVFDAGQCTFLWEAKM